MCVFVFVMCGVCLCVCFTQTHTDNRRHTTTHPQPHLLLFFIFMNRIHVCSVRDLDFHQAFTFICNDVKNIESIVPVRNATFAVYFTEQESTNLPTLQQAFQAATDWLHNDKGIPEFINRDDVTQRVATEFTKILGLGTLAHVTIGGGTHRLLATCLYLYLAFALDIRHEQRPLQVSMELDRVKFEHAAVSDNQHRGKSRATTLLSIVYDEQLTLLKEDPPTLYGHFLHTLTHAG